MLVTVFAMLFALLAGCGSLAPGDYPSLLEMQPYVLSIDPPDGASVGADVRMTVEFSRPVDSGSVGSSTLAVMEDSGETELAMLDDLEDGDTEGLACLYEFAWEAVSLAPVGGLAVGADYVVIATPQILSVEGLPLNQAPGQAPEPFVSRFSVGGAGDAPAGGGADGEGGAEAQEVVRVRPSWLVINEVLYDAAGSDSDGELFVELAGEAGGDITGYTIALVNGEDGAVKETISVPDEAVVGEGGLYLIADAMTGSPGVSRVVGADFVDNFDPQNGPDCIQLIDHEGGLVDALGYGEPLVGTAENGLACYEGVPALDAASGESLARTEGVDTGDNGADFTPCAVPTPGNL